MPDLPARPDLDQLRHQAKDLLHAAQRGDPDATARIATVSRQLILSSAQLALAREYGFASWAKLKLEVERRDILNRRHLSRLTRLLPEHPELATRPMEHWADRQHGEPLGYITMMRFNHDRLGLPRELPGIGAIARALIDAGAPVNGHPGDKETPLITAANFGDADVASVLIEAGADIDAISAPDSGGVPSSTALGHAAVFGMTEVIDVLVAAGAPTADSPIAGLAAGICEVHRMRAGQAQEGVVALWSSIGAGTGDQGNLACQVAAHRGAPVVMRGRVMPVPFLAGVEGFCCDDVG